ARRGLATAPDGREVEAWPLGLAWGLARRLRLMVRPARVPIRLLAPAGITSLCKERRGGRHARLERLPRRAAILLAAEVRRALRPADEVVYRQAGILCRHADARPGVAVAAGVYRVQRRAGAFDLTHRARPPCASSS